MDLGKQFVYKDDNIEYVDSLYYILDRADNNKHDLLKDFMSNSIQEEYKLEELIKDRYKKAKKKEGKTTMNTGGSILPFTPEDYAKIRRMTVFSGKKNLPISSSLGPGMPPRIGMPNPLETPGMMNKRRFSFNLKR